MAITQEPIRSNQPQRTIFSYALCRHRRRRSNFQPGFSCAHHPDQLVRSRFKSSYRDSPFLSLPPDIRLHIYAHLDTYCTRADIYVPRPASCIWMHEASFHPDSLFNLSSTCRLIRYETWHLLRHARLVLRIDDHRALHKWGSGKSTIGLRLPSPIFTGQYIRVEFNAEYWERSCFHLVELLKGLSCLAKPRVLEVVLTLPAELLRFVTQPDRVVLGMAWFDVPCPCRIDVSSQGSREERKKLAEVVTWLSKVEHKRWGVMQARIVAQTKAQWRVKGYLEQRNVVTRRDRFHRRWHEVYYDRLDRWARKTKPSKRPVIPENEADEADEAALPLALRSKQGGSIDSGYCQYRHLLRLQDGEKKE